MANVRQKQSLNDLLDLLYKQVMDIEMSYLNKQKGQKLSLNDMQLLKIINKYDYPSMSNIADALNLTNGTITTAIKKLENKNYVKRNKDHLDHRMIRVSLTQKGVRTVHLHNQFHQGIVGDLYEESQNDEILLEGLHQLTYFFKKMKERY